MSASDDVIVENGVKGEKSRKPGKTGSLDQNKEKNFYDFAHFYTLISSFFILSQSIVMDNPMERPRRARSKPVKLRSPVVHEKLEKQGAKSRKRLAAKRIKVS